MAGVHEMKVSTILSTTTVMEIDAIEMRKWSMNDIIRPDLKLIISRKVFEFNRSIDLCIKYHHTLLRNIIHFNVCDHRIQS
ncbi:hypothetical protein BLOT_001857 [Blomia tropicalis]|nr:hypothetical protein BLOT_001857 [Blomia tropicalis]